MKKKDDNKREVTRIKLKKTKGSMVYKRRNQKEPDPWKEIRLKLKPLGKAYNKFIEKRRIAKQKEEERRLKEQEKQRLREEEALRLEEQKEKRLKKEKKIKEEEERRLRTQEKHRLKEKKIKEDLETRIKKEQIYKERLIRGEQERIKQLERVSKLREEETLLKEARRLKIESKLNEEKRLKDEKKLIEEEKRLKEKKELELEHRLKKDEEEKLKEVKKLHEKQIEKRLNGKVKWFNSAKGYGFIKREGDEKDIFFHSSAVKNAGLRYLNEGEQLTFEIEYTDKGPSAVNLQKIVSEVSRPHLKVVK